MLQCVSEFLSFLKAIKEYSMSPFHFTELKLGPLTRCFLSPVSPSSILQMFNLPIWTTVEEETSLSILPRPRTHLVLGSHTSQAGNSLSDSKELRGLEAAVPTIQTLAGDPQQEACGLTPSGINTFP